MFSEWGGQLIGEESMASVPIIMGVMGLCSTGIQVQSPGRGSGPSGDKVPLKLANIC